MARKPREASAVGLYHVMMRGVNKKDLFHGTQDYLVYKDLLKTYKERLEVKIHHYCLMTNHTHLLVGAEKLDTLRKFGFYIQKMYAHYYQRKHLWSGQVFRRAFKSKPIQEETYLLECGRYIERNPLRAGMVKDVAAYPYSSHVFYAYGVEDTLIASYDSYMGLGVDAVMRRNVYARYVGLTRLTETGVKELKYSENYGVKVPV